MKCPLCGSINIVVNQIYDEGLGGSRYKGRCVDCELEVMSDTFPDPSRALNNLIQTWGDIKPERKVKNGRNKSRDENSKRTRR